MAGFLLHYEEIAWTAAVGHILSDEVVGGHTPLSPVGAGLVSFSYDKNPPREVFDPLSDCVRLSAPWPALHEERPTRQDVRFGTLW